MSRAADFRDPALVKALVAEVRRDVEALGRPVTLMEVCGTHTVAVSRSGLRGLLHGFVDLRSGPGCPVCVTSETDLDRMVALALAPGTVVVTFGDMVRVPGTVGTLEEARAAGADVRVVYSAEGAVRAAAEEPERLFVFLGVGFETTQPGVALALREADRLGLENFCVLSAHKTLPEALRALIEPGAGGGARGGGARGGDGAGGRRLDGFILPGHVSAVIGRRAYDFMANEYGLPGAVTGFEPVDILVAVRELVRSVRARRARVLNLYSRVVREEGNPRARAIVDRFFEPCPAEWRGLGTIPASGLKLRPEWERFDASVRLRAALEDGLARARARAQRTGHERLRRACRCGDVLRGELLPPECPLFGRSCTPVRPVGPCMVSTEGSCAAYYRYEGRGDRV